MILREASLTALACFDRAFGVIRKGAWSLSFRVVQALYSMFQQQSGRWASRAKCPYLKKDGRHPKYENHGRIAGR
jgi:hypothetical protein